MASWFRRLEQGVLQGIGAVSSSYEKDAGYLRDEERLERLDAQAREVSSALSDYVASLRREAEAAFKYASAAERTCGAAPLAPIGAVPGGSGSPSATTAAAAAAAGAATAVVSLKALTRLQHAYRTSVVGAAGTHLSEGQARTGLLLRSIVGLRAEFAARKEKVLDADSYVRRVQQAEQAARTADAASVAAAREDLRRLQGKAKDTGAVVHAASERIRSRLLQLEEELRSAALEGSLAFLASQAFSAAHAADAAAGLLPSFPGCGAHLAVLADLCVRSAGVANTSQRALGRSQDPQLNLAASMPDAMRLPVGAFVGAGDFAALHAGPAAPAQARSAPGGLQKGAGTGRPPTGEQVSQRAGIVRPPGDGAGAAPSKRAGEAAWGEAVAVPAAAAAPGADSGVGGGPGAAVPNGGASGDADDDDETPFSFAPVPAPAPAPAAAAPPAAAAAAPPRAAAGAPSAASSSSSLATPAPASAPAPALPSSLTAAQQAWLAGAAASDLCIGLYAFAPESADEIALRVGGLVRVLSRTDDGWWRGRCASTGKEGLFPFNRTRMLSPAESSKVLQMAAPAAIKPGATGAAASAPAAAAKSAAAPAPAAAAATAARPAATALAPIKSAALPIGAVPAKAAASAGPVAAPAPVKAAAVAPAAAAAVVPLSPSAFDVFSPAPAAKSAAAVVADPFSAGLASAGTGFDFGPVPVAAPPRAAAVAGGAATGPVALDLGHDSAFDLASSDFDVFSAK